MAHAVVRTDKMSGTDVRADLVSLKYMGAGSTETAIDNGCVVVLDSLVEGEREVYKAVTPAANSSKAKIALVASVEINPDPRKSALSDFENEAGKISRGYKFKSGDIFSVTADALAGIGDSTDVGDVVELQAGVKLKVVSSATQGSTSIGKLIEIAQHGMYLYYTIQVD